MGRAEQSVRHAVHMRTKGLLPVKENQLHSLKKGGIRLRLTSQLKKNRRMRGPVIGPDKRKIEHLGVNMPADDTNSWILERDILSEPGT